MNKIIRYCVWWVIIINCLSIFTFFPNFHVDAQSVFPTVSIGLEHTVQTANVAPGESGMVQFNVTVAVDKPPGSTIIVELMAEDTWDSSTVSPTNLQFQNSGEQTAHVSVIAPPGTGYLNVGEVVITGTWKTSPGGITGKANPTDGVIGRIDIEQYHSFNLFAETYEKEGNPGSKVTFELIINNNGNWRDTFAFQIENKKALNAKDFVVKLSQAQADIESHENFTLKVHLEVPIGTGSLGEHPITVQVTSISGLENGVPAKTLTFKLSVPPSAIFVTAEFYLILFVIILLIVGLFLYRRWKKISK